MQILTREVWTSVTQAYPHSELLSVSSFLKGIKPDTHRLEPQRKSEMAYKFVYILKNGFSVDDTFKMDEDMV